MSHLGMSYVQVFCRKPMDRRVTALVFCVLLLSLLPVTNAELPAETLFHQTQFTLTREIMVFSFHPKEPLMATPLTTIIRES